MWVNRYYDRTGEFTQDSEGNLVMLCQPHHQQVECEHGPDAVIWAGDGDTESVCEFLDCLENNKDHDDDRA